MMRALHSCVGAQSIGVPLRCPGCLKVHASSLYSTKPLTKHVFASGTWEYEIVVTRRLLAGLTLRVEPEVVARCESKQSTAINLLVLPGRAGAVPGRGRGNPGSRGLLDPLAVCPDGALAPCPQCNRTVGLTYVTKGVNIANT